ncbi:hypothetical protein PspLS_08230 [Pyricularia sp. CBS 133598]|nr:hypothetical protein PspLS_08230 [Pyricularia sp. CBS 133598]
MAVFVSPLQFAICLFWAVSGVAYGAVEGIEPAVATVAETQAAGAPLQGAEIRQLTDEVVDSIARSELTADYARYFAFEDVNAVNATGRLATAACKVFPGDPDWPVNSIWEVFNALLGKALIPTKPIGAPCYDSQWGPKDETECANIITNLTNANFLNADPTANYWPIFQGRTCRAKNDTSGSECTLGGYPEFAVNVTNVAQIQLAINFVRATNVRLVIKNTDHCYLGKSLGAGALSLWMHNMKDINFLPDYKGPGYSGPALKLAAGVTVREAYEAAEKHGVSILALRGGGGGTFGVVASVIVRAHPKMNVVTAKWTLDTSNNSNDQFWQGVRKFYDEFLNWTDAGLYSFYSMWPTPQLTMTYMFAPNHTLESYSRVVQPFFDHLDANNISLSVSHQATPHTSFYSAYQATWGGNQFPVGSDTSLPANRLVPRRNFVEKHEATYALIKAHVSSGKHFLGFHNAPSNAAAGVGNQDNAVNPAFREMALFLVTSSNRSADHSTPAALASQSKYLQEQVLQPWRDVSPVGEGGGTYLNEASVEEADWMESFYGGHYPRLSQIKRKWDPNDVFYAVTAVGSERWVVEDGAQGVQTQNGRLCRVRL